MADLNTAKYLEENIGPCLAKGLTALSTAQPVDPIDFLAQWIKQYADSEEADAKREMEQRILEEERAKKRTEQKIKEAKLQKKLDELAAIDKARDDLLAKFEEATEWSDEYWKELIAVVQRITGAKSVYVGIHEDLGEGNVGISYEYAPDQPWMTEKRLAQGKGVTYGVFESQPSDDKVQQMNLFKSPPAVEAAPEYPYLPVYIECVTDCPEMMYFDMTRLGSYLACPIVYSSYYSDAALKAAVEFETLKAQQEEELRALEAAKEAAENGEGEIGETEEAKPPPEELVLKLPGSDVKMVIAMDTLGTNAPLDTSKIPELRSLCLAIGKCKTRTEEKQVDEQAQFVLKLDKKESIESDYMQYCTEAMEKNKDAFEKEKAELAEFVAIEKSDADAAQLAALEQVLGKSLSEAKGDLFEKKFKFQQARDVVVNMQEHIMELTSWVVVGKEMKSIIAACALLLGFKRENVYMKKKNGLWWEKLVGLLSKALFQTIDKVDVAGVRKDLQDEEKLAFIKPLAYPGEFSEENAGELSPAFKALFVYVRAAFEYRYLDVKFRKATLDAKEKAAAEGGEEGAPAPPPTDPEEIDDDFADIANITI